MRPAAVAAAAATPARPGACPAAVPASDPAARDRPAAAAAYRAPVTAKLATCVRPRVPSESELTG